MSVGPNTPTMKRFGKPNRYKMIRFETSLAILEFVRHEKANAFFISKFLLTSCELFLALNANALAYSCQDLIEPFNLLSSPSY